jgi:hypothetical protein
LADERPTISVERLYPFGQVHSFRSF